MSSEKEIVITDPGKWFAAFESATNQKQITEEVLSTFLTKLFADRDTISFLDVGCASGNMAANLINNIGKDRVSYVGTDSEKAALENAKKLFTLTNIKKAKFIEGDCFSADLQEQLPESDIVLASHIAYYAEDVKSFATALEQKHTANGVTISIHDAPNSDTNQLRTKYKANVALTTSNDIEEHLGTRCELHAFSYKTLLQFPDNMSDLWETLATPSTKSHQPNFAKAKHLLEFVAQQSLEDLNSRGLLDPYLTEVREKLAIQDNCLFIRSRLHIATSPDLEQEFSTPLDTALIALNSAIEDIETRAPKKLVEVSI